MKSILLVSIIVILLLFLMIKYKEPYTAYAKVLGSLSKDRNEISACYDYCFSHKLDKTCSLECDKLTEEGKIKSAPIDKRKSLIDQCIDLVRGTSSDSHASKAERNRAQDCVDVNMSIDRDVINDTLYKPYPEEADYTNAYNSFARN